MSDLLCSMLGGKKGRKAAEGVKVIPMARANNVAIMLTQFGGFPGGPAQLREELLAAPGLMPDQAEAVCMSAAAPGPGLVLRSGRHLPGLSAEGQTQLRGLSAEQLSLLLQVPGLPCPP